MTTKFLWVLPAFYETPTNDALIFDLTEHGKKILENKVWERGFDYGYTASLKNLDPNSLTYIGFTVSPLVRGAYAASKSENIIRDVVGRVPDNTNLLAHVNLSWPRNFLIIEGNFKFETEIPKSIVDHDEPVPTEFIETFHRLVALMEELGALFRASAHLMFLSDYPIIPSMANRHQGGGLVYMESQDKWIFDPWGTAVYTFPAIFIKPDLEYFNSMLALMADIWHLPLWPIHRFLKALNAEYIEMESLLDLLFALEGLFPKSASSDFIRVASALFLGKNRKESHQINEALERAFQIRNEVVHGAQYYTGFEKVNLEGREVLSQQVFWKVRRIVAGMTQEAILKLRRTEGMRNLRITTQDVLERVFV